MGIKSPEELVSYYMKDQLIIGKYILELPKVILQPIDLARNVILIWPERSSLYICRLLCALT